MSKHVALAVLFMTILGIANSASISQIVLCPEMTNVYCEDVYDPVCGANGVTYGNACSMRQATCNKVSVAFKGTCDSVAVV